MKNIVKFKLVVAISIFLTFSMSSYKILLKIWSKGSQDFTGISSDTNNGVVLNLPSKARNGNRKTSRSENAKQGQRLDEANKKPDQVGHKVIPLSVQDKKEFYSRQKKKHCGVGWQKRYIAYHKQVVSHLGKRGKFLVYLCGGKGYGCGGYGNRLNAITSLLLLAILTDRVFLIDWKYSISLKDYFLPNQIDWTFSVDEFVELNSSRSYWGAGHPAKVTKDVRRPFQGHSQFRDFITETDFRTHFDQPVEIVTAMWYFAEALIQNRYLNGKLSEMLLGDLRFSWIGCAFDFLFVKTEAVEKSLRLARKTTGIGDGVPVIGIHIRMGDEAFGKKSKKGMIRTRNYMKIVNCAFTLESAILQANPQLRNRHLRIFLAADDVNVKRFLLKKYPAFASLDVKIEHISHFRSKKNLPSKEGMMGVLLDHFLLSECDFLVLSRSTFGLTAAGLTFHLKESYTLAEKCNYNV